MVQDGGSGFRPINRRVRMTPEQRREQIATQAAGLIARYGSYGVSMQAIADAVGLTLPGLYHYVKDRDELLALVVERNYDRTMPSYDALAGEYRAERGLPDDAPLSLPWMLHRMVERNAERPELVTLFMRLAVEAADPHHPAHAFYRDRHHAVLANMTAQHWNLPEAYRDQERLHDLVVTAYFAMDGVQVQALTNPDETMVELWARAERVLFPSPQWDGYR